MKSEDYRGEQLAHRHKASKWVCWNLSPGGLGLEPVSLVSPYALFAIIYGLDRLYFIFHIAILEGRKFLVLKMGQWAND